MICFAMYLTAVSELIKTVLSWWVYGMNVAMLAIFSRLQHRVVGGEGHNYM